jgi:hypothetical protein
MMRKRMYGRLLGIGGILFSGVLSIPASAQYAPDSSGLRSVPQKETLDSIRAKMADAKMAGAGKNDNRSEQQLAQLIENLRQQLKVPGGNRAEVERAVARCAAKLLLA